MKLIAPMVKNLKSFHLRRTTPYTIASSTANPGLRTKTMSFQKRSTISLKKLKHCMMMKILVVKGSVVYTIQFLKKSMYVPF